MAVLGPRTYSRSILRGFVEELRHLGVLEEVRARATPELLPLLSDPRRAPAWVPVAPLDEIVAAVAALRGRGAVREMGYRTMKEGGLAKVLEPIIQLTLTALGARPDSLLSRASAMASVVARGLELSWSASGSAAGKMKIRAGEKVPDLSWAPWEGALLYAYEITCVRGEVEEARPAADGRSCEIALHWTPG